MQISLALFFVFDLPSKLRVVYIRKKFHFLKNGSNDFHQILWIYCTFKPQHMALLAFPGKICVARKIFFYFLSIASPNVAPNPTDQSCSNSIFKILLQLSSASPFHFRPILNIEGSYLNVKGSSHKKTILNVHFLKKGSNDFHQTLCVYSTFEPQQYGTLGFSRKKKSL